MLKYFKKPNLLLLFILTQFLAALLAFTNDYLVNSLQSGGTEDFSSLSEKIVLVLVIAPVFETLIFILKINCFFVKY